MPYTVQNSNGDTSPPADITVTVDPINDPPTIRTSSIQPLTRIDATGALTFTIADVDNTVGIADVSCISDDQAIVPDLNIVIGGTGTTLTVTVMPLANQNGPVTITLTVTDAPAASATEDFLLTVTPVSDSPTITTIVDLSIAKIMRLLP